MIAPNLAIKNLEVIGSGSGSEELCDKDLVEQFEADERAKGVLNDEEIETEGSKMLGRYLEKKWKRDANANVFLASGRVKKLPNYGNIPVEEWERWSKDYEMDDLEG